MANQQAGQWWLEIRHPEQGVGQPVAGSYGTVDEVKNFAAGYLLKPGIPPAATLHLTGRNRTRRQLYPSPEPA